MEGMVIALLAGLILLAVIVGAYVLLMNPGTGGQSVPAPDAGKPTVDTNPAEVKVNTSEDYPPAFPE